ncbi:MAG: glycosyltransferase [Candidatus Methylopumilus sp.]|nr:glycosyltransferase [Candidatus Methylopumilus sp.]
MKISIVTISFNQEKYLRQCIDSILSQTECDFEYIVVDPGSTDGSRALIESYGEKIIRVFEPDQGPADGLNRGFSRASGQIYGFINSDDYLQPNALRHVSKYFKARGRRNFVTGQGYTEHANGVLTRIRPKPLTVQNMLHRSAVLFQQGTFFPASAYKEVGGFNVSNSTCWDYELFLRFLLRGLKHEVIPQDLAAFRLHEGSISGSGRLTELYLQDLDKLFVQVYGRERSVIDRLFTQFLRVKRELACRLRSH